MPFELLGAGKSSDDGNLKYIITIGFIIFILATLILLWKVLLTD